jgi:lipoprotein-anchoring transpeptidase ErfK/SrfK
MRAAGNGTRRRGAAAVGAAGLAALIALAGCTSSGSDVAGTGSGGADGTGATTTAPGTSQAPSSSAAASPIAFTNSAEGRRVSPIKPVTIAASNGTLTSVVMRNDAGRKVSGALASDGTSWHNTEVLGYSKTYRVTARAKDSTGRTVVKHTTVRTLTPDNMTQPYIDTVYGSSIDDGAIYGVGMVVNVVFDEQIPDKAAAEKALQVTTSPQVEGSWYWVDDSHVHWRPKNYYAPGTKVTVAAKVYGKNLGDGLYGQSDQSVSFTIGQKRLSVADAATHRVKVYFHDKLVRTMPTSMGQGGTTAGKNGQTIYLWTMPGTYTVIGHENPATMSSDSYGLPANSPLGYAPEKVPYATKISTDGIYLHELDTTVWAQGSENVSHGCLNLNYDNAKWYYEHSRVGDVVKVVHSGGPVIQLWQGGDWQLNWKQWQQGSALS